MNQPGQPIHVLIVDDDEAIRDAVRYVLEDAGYVVTDAESADEALRALRESPYRLVALLDQVMPMMEGADLLEILAQDDTLARRHAYALVTASGKVGWLEARLAALPALDAPLLRKPFSIDEVLAVVAQLGARLASD